MSGDGTYRVELAYAPDSNVDLAPWRARIYSQRVSLTASGPEPDGHALLQTVWGSTQDLALLHAREWIKSRNSHGEPETVLLDRNGDLVQSPDGFSVKA